MDWQVQIERKAYKSNIIEAIDGLANEPRPQNCTKLKGATDLWRVRVGTYRIVYQINDDQLLILVIRIGHRSDVY